MNVLENPRGRIAWLALALLTSSAGVGCSSSPRQLDPPGDLSYATNPAVYAQGIAIAPNLPQLAGGTGTSWSVTPDLPVGLVLDPTTGAISGTPTAVVPAADYTVTAASSLGSARVVLSIAIKLDAPPDTLVYAVNPATYALGTPITPNLPRNGGGAVASYAVAPALPPGLSLNVGNGVISGTPTAIAAAATYTVTGTNHLGSTTASLVIGVVQPPTISLQPADQAVYVGLTATFSVIASGDGALTYQWQKGGIAIGGATFASYATPAVTEADGGAAFTVVVRDPAGHTTTSAPATLQVKVWSSFASTGSLGTARSGHTATLLPGGKVLVAGGSGGASLGSAELYDPAAATFALTGSLGTARSGHTATLLPGGKVLVAGGYNGGPLTSAELYDPGGGSFAPTGSLGVARSGHTATLLPSGKVLITGGYDLVGFPTTGELYDPAAGTFAPTGTLSNRDAKTATLLPSGKVLLAGGVDNVTGSYIVSAELYDPAAGTFALSGGLGVPRSAHTATLLPEGKVLIAGGARVAYLSSAELYDPAAGTFAAAGTMGATKFGHTATLLPGGKVFIAGGYGGTSLSSAELYDPAAGTFAPTGSLGTSRYNHTATLLPDGRVLVVGGYNGAVLASAELYQ